MFTLCFECHQYSKIELKVFPRTCEEREIDEQCCLCLTMVNTSPNIFLPVVHCQEEYQCGTIVIFGLEAFPKYLQWSIDPGCLILYKKKEKTMKAAIDGKSNESMYTIPITIIVLNIFEHFGLTRRWNCFEIDVGRIVDFSSRQARIFVAFLMNIMKWITWQFLNSISCDFRCVSESSFEIIDGVQCDVYPRWIVLSFL